MGLDMTKWIVAALLTLTLQAKADQITLGYYDGNNPGAGVVPFASSPGPIHITNQHYGAFGGNVSALTFTDSLGSTWREFAFDDFFQSLPDTIRLYADFQGITTTPGNNIFPTIWQRNEAAGNGIVVAEEIFACADGVLFCDNSVVGGGTLLGVQIWNSLGTIITQYNMTVPAQFDVTEVFTIAWNGSPPVVDFAGAILTQPDPPAAVPGPIAGAGLPGIIAAACLLLLRRRRKVS
jgi:hypothetical protein